MVREAENMKLEEISEKIKKRIIVKKILILEESHFQIHPWLPIHLSEFYSFTTTHIIGKIFIVL